MQTKASKVPFVDGPGRWTSQDTDARAGHPRSPRRLPPGVGEGELVVDGARPEQRLSAQVTWWITDQARCFRGG